MSALLTINISNDPLSGFKRKVDVEGFQFIEDGMREGKIFTKCRYFINNNNEYGDEITSLRYKSYDRNLEANNRRLINPENGLVVTLQDGEYKDPLGNVVTEPIGQFDHFRNLIKMGSINIIELLTNIVTAEDTFYGTYNE